MSFKPLHDRLLLKPLAAETRTKAGLIIPDTAQEKPMQGKVVAVGKGRRLEMVDEGILAVRHHVSGDGGRVPTPLNADFPMRPANGARTFQRAEEGVACPNIHPD